MACFLIAFNFGLIIFCVLRKRNQFVNKEERKNFSQLVNLNTVRFSHIFVDKKMSKAFNIVETEREYHNKRDKQRQNYVIENTVN
ncbi:hypothetical protein NUSPORA_01254 [Nucleospora cyclopteri]